MQERVLNVDDDRRWLDRRERVLARDGYDVVSTNDGGIAYSMLQRGEFYAAILDYKMQGMTGLEMALKMKAEGIPTPVVILTQEDSAELIRQIQEAGAEYVNKADRHWDIELGAAIDCLLERKGMLFKSGDA